MQCFVCYRRPLRCTQTVWDRTSSTRRCASLTRQRVGKSCKICWTNFVWGIETRGCFIWRWKWRCDERTSVRFCHSTRTPDPLFCNHAIREETRGNLQCSAKLTGVYCSAFLPPGLWTLGFRDLNFRGVCVFTRFYGLLQIFVANSTRRSRQNIRQCPHVRGEWRA